MSRMKYLESITFPNEDEEYSYLWQPVGKIDMQCYSSTNVYPFKLFPQKELERLDFEPITVIYGGNGSGKSTILNLIAEKLGVERMAPFNNTPYIEDYLNFCNVELTYGKGAPKGSRIIIIIIKAPKDIGSVIFLIRATLPTNLALPFLEHIRISLSFTYSFSLMEQSTLTVSAKSNWLF